MTLKVRLVNMPFADVRAPSIALTQLKAVTEAQYPGQVSIEIAYLNQQFGRLLGMRHYDFIATSTAGHTSGLGEWLFRGIAFPEQPDNRDVYLERYRHHFDGEQRDVVENHLCALRARLAQILDGLIRTYRLHEADVVGLTSMFFQNLPSIALAQRLRRMNPDQIIVMGGANCEGPMGIELINNVPALDLVFSGHSLISFPQAIGNLLDGNREALHDISGVFSRRNSQSAAAVVARVEDVDWGRFGPERLLKNIRPLGTERSIEATVALDYDDFLASLKRLLPEEVRHAQLFFETSRGCWWGERAHCTFCGLNGGTMAYRSMRPEQALQVIESLFERYAGEITNFDSVDNILPKEYFEAVFGRLRAPEHVSLFYEVKSDLTEQQMQLLARGKVRRIQPGIEALATPTLKLMRKGTTAFHGLQTLRHCKRYRITPYWNLLIGFPGESAEIYAQYAKTLPLLRHLPPPSGVFPVRFDRFSPYFTQQKEYGLRLAPSDYYALCYPFPAVALQNMAYFFQDLNYDAPYVRYVSEWLLELRDLTGQWKRSWEGSQPPVLGVTRGDSGACVDDTRDGTRRSHRLNGGETEFLRKIAQPVRVDDLAEEIRTHLDFAQSQGWVFTERGRVASLMETAAE